MLLTLPAPLHSKILLLHATYPLLVCDGSLFISALPSVIHCGPLLVCWSSVP